MTVTCTVSKLDCNICVYKHMTVTCTDMHTVGRTTTTLSSESHGVSCAGDKDTNKVNMLNLLVSEMVLINLASPTPSVRIWSWNPVECDHDVG